MNVIVDDRSTRMRETWKVGESWKVRKS